MVEITWLGHGTFQLKLESGEVWLLDPWTDSNPAYPKGHSISRLDVMLVSHGHFDHLQDFLPLAQKFEPKVVCIFELGHYLESKGVRNVSTMNKGGSQQIGGVKVTMTHAIHSGGIVDDDGRMIYGGEAAGFVLRFSDGRAMYLACDTTVFSDMALIGELYKPELALLPIGDLFTMSPFEAAAAVRMLKTPQVIPTHYGTFPPLTGRPEHLAKLIEDMPGTRVWTLAPGVPVQW